jgi:hypothetical protein
MLQDLIQLCTSRTGLFSFSIMSDLAIAASYFAIPLTMAVVFRRRKDDIPYPWLWILFVAFIVACGLTHLAHVWSAFRGVENLAGQAVINFLCAAVSVGTAIAFAYIIPQINELPSPKKTTSGTGAAGNTADAGEGPFDPRNKPPNWKSIASPELNRLYRKPEREIR